jgi:carbonic anhydrase
VRPMKPLLPIALFVAALLAGAAPAMAAESPDWSYQGATGPANWASLDPEYAACGAGVRQSPIALGAASGRPESLSIRHRPARLEVENNARTIETVVEGAGGIVLGGRRYELVQFHFHAASEHTIQGRRAPLEAHLVHRSADGRLAVLGVLIRAGGRRAPRILDAVLRNAPGRPGASVELEDRFDPETLLPRDRTRYSYAGSLTTPPCTENVAWQVYARPLRVPAAVIERFTRLYAEGNRPLQPANGRAVSLG